MCDMQGSVTFVNKVLTEQNFRLQFLLHDFSKTIPRKSIYPCLAALYINTGVSFKSNKKLLLLASYFRYSIYSKRTSVFRISSQHQCVTCVTMPEKLIILPVRDNLSSHWALSKKSEGSDILYSISRILFPEIKRQAYRVSYKINPFCALHSR